MTSLPTPTALVPVVLTRSLPVRRSLPLVARDGVVPALGASLAMAAAGLAVELMLRAVANRVVVAMRAPLERAAPAVTRTVITEWTVVERARRLP